MVNTKKDILNPLDSLHHDPQKLYEKRVHQSTQIWPRNGGKSSRVLVSLHDLLRASRVNKGSLAVIALTPQEPVTFPLAALQSSSTGSSRSRRSTVSLHSKHSHEQEQTSNTVFSRVSTWHTLSDFKEERKESGGSHFYHPTTMFQPWMKIPLSQLFFLFSGLLERCNELVIICFHSRKSAKL